MSIADRMLDHIKTFQQDNPGASPTFRDFLTAGICSSTSQVHYHLDRLERLGLLRRVGPRKHGIILTGAKLNLPR